MGRWGGWRAPSQKSVIRKLFLPLFTLSFILFLYFGVLLFSLGIKFKIIIHSFLFFYFFSFSPFGLWGCDGFGVAMGSGGLRWIWFVIFHNFFSETSILPFLSFFGGGFGVAMDLGLRWIRSTGFFFFPFLSFWTLGLRWI